MSALLQRQQAQHCADVRRCALSLRAWGAVTFVRVEVAFHAKLNVGTLQNVADFLGHCARRSHHDILKHHTALRRHDAHSEQVAVLNTEHARMRIPHVHLQHAPRTSQANVYLVNLARRGSREMGSVCGGRGARVAKRE